MTGFDSSPMFNLKKLIAQREGENLDLHRHINPQFAKVLAAIGFDKVYCKGQGVSLFDRDGNEFYDFLSGFGVFALGRNHPCIKEVIRDFLDLDTANLVKMEAPLLSGLLAERLVHMFGNGERDKVFFTNSGTEAVETAIKFARAATGREKILHLNGSFHGLTNGSLSINGNAEFKNGFGKLLPAEAVALNNLNHLEDKLKTRQFAAFVFEPVLGKGVFVPEQNFLSEAAKLCRKYGACIVADEIQTGLGRTGRWLACEHFQIEPDILCLSKALSGGMVPVGAVVYTSGIYERVFSSMDRCMVHSTTFGQNDLAMICGLATLEILEKQNLVQNAYDLGFVFQEKLLALKNKHEWIKDVRGMGLMIGIEFGEPRSFKKKLAWNMVHKVDKGLFGELIVMPLLSRHRIITQVSGHHQDIVKLLPPLCLEQKHVDYFCSALDDILNQCEKVSGPIFTLGKNLVKHAIRN